MREKSDYTAIFLVTSAIRVTRAGTRLTVHRPCSIVFWLPNWKKVRLWRETKKTIEGPELPSRRHTYL